MRSTGVARKKKQDDRGLDALFEAQEMIYDAWEADTLKQRVALAKKALATSPLCADAHVILAEAAKEGTDEELDHWRAGVEAGKAAIGPEFDDLVGDFWGFLETRPYMRARLGLAQTLWSRGAREEAVDHLKEMLRLNPNDNQGVRDGLANCLAVLGRDEDLAALLKQYELDGSAVWAWTGALLAFRRGGDCDRSRRALEKAMKTNEHVAALLIGAKKAPKAAPPFYSPGGKDEAVIYCQNFADGWSLAPGASDWVRAQATAKRPSKRNSRAQ